MKIFSIKIDNIKYKDFFEKITKLIKARDFHMKYKNDNLSQNIIFTPNPEILLKTLNDKEFRKLLNKADYRTPDGI
ncbi:MAG: hypothetical protein LBU14_05550 [Candidatus Peribacteria bacterium]|jgi:UDP-N-acetyl-D-mannosaminuronic acid transferase (WecB/TagA/CpsF family)|nr:hypothetical protein [Candidatus Peribacteria bacterium]